MSFCICKCDKNQNLNERMTAMDLLNIKNLEKSLKSKEKKILKRDNDMDTCNSIKENLNISNDELQIIEYPYSNKNFNYKKQIYNKIIKKRKKDQLVVNLPKTNLFNENNSLFNNSQNNKINNITDLTNDSINNESLIIDDIDYLNDEDYIQIPKKRIKIENQNQNIAKEKIKKLNKNKKIKKVKENNNIKTFSNKNNPPRMSHSNSNNNNSSKSSKISKFNNNKDYNIYINKKEFSLSEKKENIKFIPKPNKKNNINYIDKSSKINDKGNYSLKKMFKNNNNNQNFLNEQYYKILKEENNLDGEFNNNKRINKRRINFKKIKLDLNLSKK